MTLVAIVTRARDAEGRVVFVERGFREWCVMRENGDDETIASCRSEEAALAAFRLFTFGGSGVET